MVTGVSSITAGSSTGSSGASVGASTTSSTSAATASAQASAQALVTSMGSGSGVDIKSLANSLVEAERAPQKAAIQARIDKSNATISGYSAIKYVLGNLQSAFADLKDQSDFSSVTASSSQPGAFNITAGPKASPGSHSIVVNTVAQPQRTLSGGFASATAALNGGGAFTLTITANGTPTTVNVPAGYTTPQDVVTAINASSAGVKAQLVNTGSGATPYRIMLTGATGAANGFTVSSSLAPPSAPALPSLTKTDGRAAITEASQVSFADLAAGDSVTVGGLTLTANQNLTAAAVAAAFSGLSNGSAGAGTSDYSFSGTLTGWSTGASTGTSLTATSTTPNSNVSDLAVSSTATAPSVVTTNGLAPITESNQVSFTTGLLAGESVTVGGLTFTASKDLSATQVSNALSDLSAGATGKTGVSYGSYSGTLTGWSTGPAAGTGFTVTSATASSNVADLALSSGAAPDYFTWGTLQSATNASLTVDGMDISFATNSIKDAISGVTLDLVAPTTGTNGATVSLGRDTSGVKTKVQALVTAYNEALTMLGVVSDPKSTVETYGATLVGNSIVSSVRNQVREMVVGNSTSPSGTFKALRDIGLSIDKTGQLQVDATKLDSALQGNFDDVVKLLSNNQENQSKFNLGAAGVAGEAYRKLVAMLDPSGTLSTQSSNQGTKITAYQKQLDALEARMQVLLKRYTEQFSAMDSLVGRIKSTQSGLKSSFDGMMAAYTSK